MIILVVFIIAPELFSRFYLFTYRNFLKETIPDFCILNFVSIFSLYFGCFFLCFLLIVSVYLILKPLHYCCVLGAKQLLITTANTFGPNGCVFINLSIVEHNEAFRYVKHPPKFYLYLYCAHKYLL